MQTTCLNRAFWPGINLLEFWVPVSTGVWSDQASLPEFEQVSKW